MTAKVEPMLTVADLDLMPDDNKRYEIVEGELIVSRAPGLTHQRVSVKLVASIENYLSDNPIGEVLATPGVIFDDFNGVIPDLVFVSKDRRNEVAAGERITGAPDLIVEIISPGIENERRDRVIKLQQYAKFGVSEYWIVDAQNHSIDVYCLDSQILKLTATFGSDDEISSALLPGYSCRVANFFRF
jgi:Uma2 family endonuclease